MNIGSEELIRFAVDVRSPLITIPRNGIESVTSGRWLPAPHLFRSCWPDPEFSSYTSQKKKAWAILIKDVSSDPSCPEFGATMSSREFDIFVSKYFSRLVELCADEENGIDYRFYFRRKNEEYSCYEYLVPGYDFDFERLMNKASRERVRVEALEVLQSMCDDPYQFNRMSISKDISQYKFDKKEAEYYLARMRIFLRRQDLEGVDSALFPKALSDRFVGSDVIFQEIRDKSISLIAEKGCRIISSLEFDNLFSTSAPVAVEPESLLMTFSIDTPNDKGWMISTWDGSRQSHYQKVAYDSLVELWRMNCDVPTVDALKKYWRDVSKDLANSFGVRVDQKNSNILFPGKEANAVELESSEKTSAYIKKFVKKNS